MYWHITIWPSSVLYSAGYQKQGNSVHSAPRGGYYFESSVRGVIYSKIILIAIRSRNYENVNQWISPLGEMWTEKFKHFSLLIQHPKNNKWALSQPYDLKMKICWHFLFFNFKSSRKQCTLIFFILGELAEIWPFSHFYYSVSPLF